jgi:hypothetical protein
VVNAEPVLVGEHMRRIKELGIVFCISIGLFGCVIVLPCSCEGVEGVRNGDARAYSVRAMKFIAPAMHSYIDEHGTLPPAVVRSKDGKPLYSWRLLLLPYLTVRTSTRVQAGRTVG